MWLWLSFNAKVSFARTVALYGSAVVSVSLSSCFKRQGHPPVAHYLTYKNNELIQLICLVTCLVTYLPTALTYLRTYYCLRQGVAHRAGRWMDPLPRTGGGRGRHHRT